MGCINGHCWRPPTFPLPQKNRYATLLGPQSRFGDKLFGNWVDCPQNGTAVLQGLNYSHRHPQDIIGTVSKDSSSRMFVAYWYCGMCVSFILEMTIDLYRSIAGTIYCGRHWPSMHIPHSSSIIVLWLAMTIDGHGSPSININWWVRLCSTKCPSIESIITSRLLSPTTRTLLPIDRSTNPSTIYLRRHYIRISIGKR